MCYQTTAVSQLFEFRGLSCESVWGEEHLRQRPDWQWSVGVQDSNFCRAHLLTDGHST